VEESVHLSNYPGNWIEHYADERYQFVDPVLHQTIRSPVPFDWQTPWFMRKRDELRGFFDEAGDVGIKSGLTIPFHKGDRPAAALSIASEETPAEANKILEEYGDTLHLLGMYFYIHVERVLRTAKGTFVYLTPRESECLKWQAAGKTMWEIAKILSISERTVQFHIDNARAKLGANTIPHAVALAVKNSLIKI